MYKVLKPIPGYGYCIGDETEHFKEDDFPHLIAFKYIEKVEPKKVNPKKKK